MGDRVTSARQPVPVASRRTAAEIKRDYKLHTVDVIEQLVEVHGFSLEQALAKLRTIQKLLD